MVYSADHVRHPGSGIDRLDAEVIKEEFKLKED
jgi:hypothetical protein